MGKRKGELINGWVVVDKPAGTGSTTVVAVVKRLFNAQKAGHAGTLDPAASGVLPVALGEATKTIPYVMDGAKTYRFSVAWGAATDTDDAEGNVIASDSARPSEDAILRIIPEFTGEIEQVPPKYSAVHVNGKRAYDLARQNADVVLKPRRIRIDSLRLIALPSKDEAVFEVDCGKGTYVRSLARDMAEKLGCLGHIRTLRRTKCGKFYADDAFSLEYLESLGHISSESKELLPVETVLDDIPALAVTQAEARFLSNGGFLPFDRGRVKPEGGVLADGAVFQAKCGGRLTALICVRDGLVRPVRVIIQ